MDFAEEHLERSDFADEHSKRGDFVKEHSERRENQLEYARNIGIVGPEKGEVEIKRKTGTHDWSRNSPSLSEAKGFFEVKSCSTSQHSSNFSVEAKKARKQFLDARASCLADWDVRNSVHVLFKNLCISIGDMVSGKHLDCNCGNKEATICNALFGKVSRYIKLVRDVNKGSNDERYISQILEDTLANLQYICGLVKQFLSSGNFNDVKDAFLKRVDLLQQFYLKLGMHSTSLFYDKLSVYQKLNSALYGICCVCGILDYISEESGELKNAAEFRELLVVEDEELVIWKALKRHDKDDLGEQAQYCFHIAYVEHDKSLRH